MSENWYKNYMKNIEENLIGAKIIKVEYLSAKDSNDIFGWDYQPIQITLDNGVMLVPSADDEGNNAGAIFTNIKNCQTIGVQREEL